MDVAVRPKDAVGAGATRARLYGPAWTKISHGLYLPKRAGGPSTLERCAAMMSVLPRGAAMAHLTAADLYDLWTPSPPAWLPTLVVLPPGEARPQRVGLYAFRSRAALPQPHLVQGVPVVPPEICVAQLAEDLGLIDLVVAIDSALSRGLCLTEDILGGLRSRQRGLPMLRKALMLCDGRSESPWETVLRLLHVLSGIDVEPQVRIEDANGHFIARADLWIRGTRRLPEYDGAVHRDVVQHQHDLAREKALSRAGWERYGYIAKEMRDDPVHIVSDAEQALGLPRLPGRMKDWLALASGSTLTIDGRLRLARRLHRFHGA